MVRSTDQEDCWKTQFVWREEHQRPCCAQWGSTRVRGRQQERGETWAGAFTVVSARRNREAACAGLGMASLSNVGGLGEGAVPGRQIDTGLCRDKGWVQ